MKTAKISRYVIATVCVLLVFAVAAALLFGNNGDNLPANGNIVADTAEGADITNAAYPVTADGYTHGSNVKNNTTAEAVGNASALISAIQGNKTFRLTQDITLSSSQIQSIWNVTFGGTLYGNGHKIEVSFPSTGNVASATLGNSDHRKGYGGLCGILTGKIYDLNFVHTGGQLNIKNTGNNSGFAGGLVGSVEGGTIENVKVTLSDANQGRVGFAKASAGSGINPTSYYVAAGALAGRIYSGTVRNVTVVNNAWIEAGVTTSASNTATDLNYSKISGHAGNLAGIIGPVQGEGWSGSVTIDNIVVEGTVSSSALVGQYTTNLGTLTTSTNISVTNFYNAFKNTFSSENNGNSTTFAANACSPTLTINNMYQANGATSVGSSTAGNSVGIAKTLTVGNGYTIYFDPAASAASSSLVVEKTGVTGGEDYSATITTANGTTYRDNYAFNAAGDTVVFRNLPTDINYWSSNGSFYCSVNVAEIIIPVEKLAELKEWENGYSDTQVSEGTGVSDGNGLVNAINNNSDIYLTQDITDFKGFTHTGTYGGTLNGNGHTIYIVKSGYTGGNAGGLFGNFSGTIKNVRVVVYQNFSISSSSSYLGAIAGELSGNAVVENCNVVIPAGVNLSFTVSSGVGAIGSIAGGIATSGATATIRNTTVELNGTLTLSAQYAFETAFVGHLKQGTLTYNDVTFKGNGAMSGTATGGEGVHTAGLGIVASDMTGVTVDGYIYGYGGSVPSDVSYYGAGFVGNQNRISPTVSNAYTYGSVTADSGNGNSYNTATKIQYTASTIASSVKGDSTTVAPYFPSDKSGKLVLVAGDGSTKAPSVLYGSNASYALGNYSVVVIDKTAVQAGSAVELSLPVSQPTVAGSLTYNGSAQAVTLQPLTAGSYTLSESDYTLTVVGNGGNASVQDNKPVNAGEYTLTVTLNGNYAFADAGKTASVTFTVAKHVLEGALEFDDAEYDGNQKEAVFALTGTGPFNGDSVSVSYVGDRENVTEAGFTATAAVPNANYTFADGREEVSATFHIVPKTVVITAVDPAPSVEYTGGVIQNDELLRLFNAPQDVEGQNLMLAFSVTKDGEEASAQYVGTYKVVATLMDSYVNENDETVYQTNYTAAECENTLTITAKQLKVILAAGATDNSVYDGNAVTADTLRAMFEIENAEAEGVYPELGLSVTKDAVSVSEVRNAGAYTVSVDLPDEYKDRYVLSDDSVTTTTYTVNKVVIDGSIVAPEDSVYDGSEKFATFEITGEGQMVGDDEIILTYATQGGQGVTQVVSAGTYTVSAALPAYEAGKSNYQWASEEIASKEIVISRAKVTIAAVENVTRDYDKSTFVNYASLFTAPNGVNGEGALALAYSVSGASTTICDAGVYTVTATLADNAVNANYEAGAAEVTYTVNVLKIEKPVVSDTDFDYDGEAKEISIAQSDYYTVGGTTSATADGNYVATVTLNDTVNTCWSDDTTEVYNIEWSIVDRSKAYVTSEEELDAALANDGVRTIIVNASFNYDKALTIDRSVVIDLNGNALTVSSKAYQKKDGSYVNTIAITNNADVTVKGNGEFRVVCAKATAADDENFKGTIARVTFVEAGATLRLLEGATYVSDNEACYPIEVAGSIEISDATVRLTGSSTYGAIYVRTNGASVNVNNSDIFFEEESKTMQVVKVDGGYTDVNVNVNYVDITATDFNSNLTFFSIASGTAKLDHITAVTDTKYAKSVQITAVSATSDENTTVVELTDSTFEINYTTQATTSKLGSVSPFYSSGGYNVKATYSGNKLVYNAGGVASSGYFYAFAVSKGEYVMTNNTVTATTHTYSAVDVIFANLSYIRNVSFVNNEISIVNTDDYASKGITFYGASSTSASTYGDSTFDIKGNTITLEDTANVRLLNAKPTDVINITSDEQGKGNTFNITATNGAGKLIFASSLTGKMTIRDNSFTTKGFMTSNVLDISSSKAGVEADSVDALFAEENNNTFSEDFTEELVGIMFENTVTTDEGTTRYYYGSGGDVFGEFGADGVTQQVKLLADMNSTLNFEDVLGNITFDLNGHNIVAKQIIYEEPTYAVMIDVTKSGSVVNINIINSAENSDVDLTVADGTTPGYGIYVRYRGEYVEGGALNVVIDNVGFTAPEYAFGTNGTDYGAKITANNSKFTGVAAGAYLAGEHDVTFNNCEISGELGIYVKSGTLKVNGGIVSGNGEYQKPEYNGSGFAAKGSAIVADACGGGYRGNLNVSVENSTIESVYGYGIELVGTNEQGTEDDFTNLIAAESNLNVFNVQSGKGFNDNMLTMAGGEDVEIVRRAPEVSVTVNDENVFTSSDLSDVAISATAEYGDETVEGTIVWDEGQTLEAGNKLYNWTFTPNDKDNYEVVSGSVQVTVIAVALERIEITTLPDDVDYEYGDAFDKTGMTVTAYYNDGTEKTVEDYSVGANILTEVGDSVVVTVSYTENEVTKTAEINIKVSAKSVTVETGETSAEKDFDGLSVDYEALFTAPSGVNGDGVLALSYAIVKDDAPYVGAIVDDGVYTITATLADTSGNYVAEAAVVTYTVNVVTKVVNVTTYAQLNNVIANANVTELVLGGNIDIGTVGSTNSGITVSKTLTVDFNGYTLNNVGRKFAVSVSGSSAVVTFKDTSEAGNGGIYGGSGGDNQAVNISGGATVTFEGGYYNVGGDANGLGNSCISIYSNSNVTINGGHFASEKQYNDRYYVINVQQTQGASGVFEIKGGTFVGQNPIYGDDAIGGNFVAEGYGAAVVDGNFVIKELRSISAVLNEGKTYEYGDKFSASDITVTATFTDESTCEVDAYTVNVSELTTVGLQEITVFYQGAETTLDVNVDKKTVTIGKSDAETVKVYDGEAFEDLASLFVAPKAIDGSTDILLAFSVTKDGELAESITGVGEYVVTATVAESESNYTATAVTATYTVSVLMIDKPEAEILSYTYDGTNKGITVAENVRYTVSGTTEEVKAGSYRATVTLVDTVNTQWTDGSVDALTFDWSIGKATLTIEGVTATSREYDGTTAVALDGGILSGVFGDDVVGFTLGEGTAASKDAANAIKVVTAIVISGEDAGNYVLTQPDHVTVDITARQIEVGWTDTALTYNGKAQAPAATVETGVVGESVTLTVDGAKTDAGADYEATAVMTVENPNYKLINDTVKFSIAKAELTGVTVNMVGWSFGDYDTVENAPSLSGNLSDGGVTYTYGGTANNGTELVDGADIPTYAGRYTVTAHVAEGANYKAAEFTADFDVNKATVNVPSIESRAWTGERIVADVPESPFYTVVTNDGGTDTGEYDVVLSLVNNYDYVWSTGETQTTVAKFSIVNKPNSWVTVPTIEGWIYGEAPNAPVFEATYGTDRAVVEYRDKNATDGDYGTSVPQTAGEYYVRVTIGGTDDYGPLTSDAVEFAIAKKTLTVTDMVIEDKVYDGDEKVTVGGELDGMIADDEVILTLNGVAEDKNAGVRAVTVTAGISGADADNYELIQPEGDFTVNVAKAELTMSDVKATDREYDGTTVVKLGGGTLEGVIAGDSVTVTIGNGTVADKNAGIGKAVTTAMTIGGADADNYELKQPDYVTVDIAARQVATEWTNTALTYNGKVQAPSASVETGVDGEALMLDVNGAERDAGESYLATVTLATDNGNYTLTNATTTFSIAKKTLTVVGVEAEDKVYDGTTAVTVTGKLDGVVSGDDTTLAISGSVKDKNVGRNKAVTVTASISGDDAGNYSLVKPADTTVNITAATLTITGVTATDREYDGTTNVEVSGGVLNGVIAGDRIYFTLTGGQTEDADVGTDKAVRVFATNDGAQKANYVLAGITGVTVNISARETEVVWSNTALTYNGNAQAPTATVETGVQGEEIVLSVSGAQTSAGSGYQAVAVMTEVNDNYALTNATTTFSIAKKTLTVSGLKAEDRIYDGTVYVKVGGSLVGVVAGDDVALSMTGTMQDKNAGENKYVTVKAAINGNKAGNYTLTEPGDAYVTVTAKTVEVVWSRTEELVYNGSAQKPVATADTGIAGETLALTVTGEQTNAGEGYVATASMVQANDNYVLANETTTFSIAKADYDMSAIVFADATFVEDGTVRSVEITGVLPDGVTVTYDGNGKSEAGVYTVSAVFATSDVNYNAPQTMFATIRINIPEIAFTDDEDLSTDATVSADEGIDPELTLVVEKADASQLEGLVASGEKVTGIYSVSLQKDGEAVVTEGTLKVRLRIPEGVSENDFRLMSVDNGELSEVAYTVEDGYVVFTTEKLTQYAFLTPEEEGSALWLIILLAAILVAEIAAIAVKKSKDKKEKGKAMAAAVFGGALATTDTVILIVLGVAVVVLGIYTIYLYVPRKKNEGADDCVFEGYPRESERVADNGLPVEFFGSKAPAASAPEAVSEEVKEEAAAPEEKIEEPAKSEAQPIVVTEEQPPVVEEEKREEAPAVQAEIASAEEDEDEEGGVLKTRYNRSFAAKIILSPEEVKSYFVEVANHLLSFKKVNSRMSWKVLTFNKGRTVLAKLGMRGKTLWLFLALEPTEFLDTKYFGEDFSELAQYDKVPYGVKVKSARGVKFAKELIDIMMSRNNVERTNDSHEYDVADYATDTQENLIAKELVKVYSGGELQIGATSSAIKKAE